MTNPTPDKKADAAETKPKEPTDNIVVTRHNAPRDRVHTAV